MNFDTLTTILAVICGGAFLWWGAINVLYAKELKAAADPKAKAAELAAAYRAEFASPYISAANGYITDVIDPAVTRSTIALSLAKALSKRETRPPKKHGNIPL